MIAFKVASGKLRIRVACTVPGCTMGRHLTVGQDSAKAFLERPEVAEQFQRGERAMLLNLVGMLGMAGESEEETKVDMDPGIPCEEHLSRLVASEADGEELSAWWERRRGGAA